MKKVAIVHFMPLEYYPPVTNMLDSLSRQSRLRVKVWTTRNIKNRPTYTNTKITQIIRLIFPRPEYNKLYRLFTYICFNLRTFLGLIVFKPRVVIYYESYSAGPIYWYFRFFGKNKSLFIHYHEYFEKAWYDQGMSIVRQYYKYENEFLWQRAQWISHTNAFRRDLFLEEYPSLKESKVHIMPNYPPDSWRHCSMQKKSSTGKVLKTVYVGSLSLKDTYIKEYCDWLLQQQGTITLDVYAYNLHEDTQQYLEELQSPYITFYSKGLAYEDLPKELPKYNIGLILYKGQTLNYIYNAPNKLFEYVACGLEVWVPEVMTGCRPYLNHKERPVVRTVDYTNLNDTLLTDYQNHLNLPFKPSAYHCEAALQPLIKALKQA